jgi:uncharacterized protein (DUF433 family)
MPELSSDVIDVLDASSFFTTGVPLFGQKFPSRLGHSYYRYAGSTPRQDWRVIHRWSVVDAVLREMAKRMELQPPKPDPEDDLRQYDVTLRKSFEMASTEYQSISVDPKVMAGAPCIEGTRIPVYMVLDAIEHYGEVEAAKRSYPRLSIQQIKDAIGFAKLVVECPIDDNLAPPAR